MDVEIIYGREFHWNSLPVTLSFERAPSDDEAEGLDDLVDAWFGVGLYGGFGDRFHTSTDQERVDERSLEWIFDLGAADDVALRTLLHILQVYSREHDVPLAKIVIGSDD